MSRPDRARRAGHARGVAEARAGRRQPLGLRARRAAWATSTLASTCGRCETVAIRRSCVSASIAAGARRGRRAAGAGARRARPRCARVGVRYQVAPSNRSARACSTPAVSAPASGWPPMKRWSSTAATTARLVEPTSVTTQSPARRPPAPRATTPGSTPTGAATNAASAPSTASAAVGARRVDRAALDRARRARPAPGSKPRDLAPRAARARRARPSRRSGRRRRPRRVTASDRRSTSTLPGDRGRRARPCST